MGLGKFEAFNFGASIGNSRLVYGNGVVAPNAGRLAGQVAEIVFGENDFEFLIMDSVGQD